MSLQKIVVLCIMILLIVAGLLYFTGSKKTAEEQMINDDSVSEEEKKESNNLSESESPSGFGSFASLLGLGQNIICDYTFDDGEGNSGSGTGYFSDQKMRVDSTMLSDGQLMDSHMINDGSMTYVWTKTAEEFFAFKMSTPVDAEVEYSAPEEDYGQVSVEQEVEYDCQRWSVDNSVFIPPEDVIFTDMEKMMQGVFDSMSEGFEMPEVILMEY